MADIIDALVVTLGLDSANFETGKAKATESLDDLSTKATQTGKNVESSQTSVVKAFGRTGSAAGSAAEGVNKGSRRTQESMRGLGVSAETVTKAFDTFGLGAATPFLKLALGAGSAVVAFEAIKKAMDDTYATAAAGAAVGRQAYGAGINVTQFAAWGNAIASVGGNASDAENSLASLAAQQQQFRITGVPSQALQGLVQLGINPSEDPTKILSDLAKNPRLRAMNPAMRNQFLTGMVGLDPTTAYAVSQGPDYVNKLLAQQNAKGNFTPEQVKTQQDYFTAVNNLKQAFDQLKGNLETDAMPALTGFTNMLTGLVNWLDNKFPAWFATNVTKPAEAAATNTDNAIKGVVNVTDTYTGDQQSRIDLGMKTLMDSGLTRAQAAGVMGNLQSESGFKTHPAVDLKNPHYGVAQWSESRRANILAHTNIDVATASLSDQYKAVAWELHNVKDYEPVIHAFNNDKNMSAVDAATLVDHGYERPGSATDPYSLEDPARGMAATNIYNNALNPNKQSPGAVAAHKLIQHHVDAAVAAVAAGMKDPGGSQPLVANPTQVVQNPVATGPTQVVQNPTAENHALLVAKPKGGDAKKAAQQAVQQAVDVSAMLSGMVDAVHADPALNKHATNPTAANHAGWWLGFNGVWHKLTDTGQGLDTLAKSAKAAATATSLVARSSTALHQGMRGGSVTNNHHHNITVHAPSGDAKAIAATTIAAIKRHGATSQLGGSLG
jgi:hypothetical protein